MDHPEAPAPDQPPSSVPAELGLTDILARSSSVLWHEAVGLVLGVAEMALAADPVKVPPADAVYLGVDGMLRFEAHGAIEVDPVTHLRGWLRQLLQDTPTPPLSDLADETDAPVADVPAFVEALRYFSRPNRQEELATLARRILGVREGAPLEMRIASLTAKIGQARNTPPERERRRMTSRFWSLLLAAGRARVVIIAAVGAILAVAFPTAPWRAGIEPGRPPADSSRPAAWAAPTSGAAARPPVLTRTAPSVSFQRSAAGAAGSDVVAGGARRRGEPPPLLAAPEARRSDAGGAHLLEPVPVRPSFADLVPGTRMEAETAPEPMAPAPPTPAPLFSPDDPDVVQPVLLSSVVPTPSVPGAPASAQVTVIDLVIDESGRVDQATLASPTVRFDERMLLSAVKAWRFKPATKDGVPVKYRARLVLTL